MKKTKGPDYILLSTLILLNLIGLVVLAGVSSIKSVQLTGKSTYFLFHQIFYGFLPGIIIAMILYKIDLNLLKKYSFLIFLFGIFLCSLVFLPKMGITLFGGRRWIKIFGFSFQPAEFLKLAFVIYLSGWLAKNKDQDNKLKTLFLPFLIILGIVALIFILQPNVSSAIFFCLIGGILYFSAKAPWWHLVILGAIGTVLILILFFTAPYRLSRLLVFLNPESDPLGEGYHIKQALIAVGSGGILGKGLGLGGQKFGFLPQPMTDSIFAVFAQETGFLGCFVVICLFLIFIWQGMKLAKNQKDEFKKLLSIGITSWIGLQAFVNIGAMIGMIPLTGVPLPFFSYGGSALLSELAGCGILLNISKKE